MIRLWRPSRRRLLAAAALAALLLPGVALAGQIRQQGETTLIELLQEAELVICGNVESVDPAPAERGCWARVLPSCVVKGQVEQGKLLVAEDLFFPSDLSSFHPGKDVLLFLTPLPTHSRWQALRSKGIRHMVVRGGDGVREMDSGSLRGAADFLRRYQELVSPKDEKGLRGVLEFLLHSLESPIELVQEASAQAFLQMNELASLLGDEDRSAVRRVLLDRQRSRKARARILEVAARLGGFEGEISRVLREEPEMRRAALAGLASREGQEQEGVQRASLEACLEDKDPHVRAEALRLLAAAPDGKSDARAGEVALRDASPEVRARAMSILGAQGGEASRPILVQGLSDESPLVVYAAGNGLIRSRGEGAVEDLARLLRSKNPKSRILGILMLGSLPHDSARRILRDASEKNPDPEVRDLCKKVLESGPPGAGVLEQVLGTDGEASKD